MEYEISRGTPTDYEDIIDFGNYVFGTDFPTLLPKLYKNHSETSEYHYLVKREHRIKAMVGSFPLGLTVCGYHLKVRGIGTVSVHQYNRSYGYMKGLMDRAMDDIKANNCDLAVLGGDRQRYEYWGFTPCGITINLNFNSSNIKHCNIHVEDEYEFVEYNNTISDDLEKAVWLYNSQLVHAVREKDNFIEISKSWKNRIYFIYKCNSFVGYICTSENNEKMNELLLKNPIDIDKVIISYIKSLNLSKTSIELQMHRTNEFDQISKICENYSINSSTNIYVINYINVIKAFLTLKNRFYPIEEGILIFNVEKVGNYKIEVKAGTVDVSESDMPYDISMPHLEASALLFSHASFVNTTYKYINPLIKSWFPLPLFYPELDNV